MCVSTAVMMSSKSNYGSVHIPARSASSVPLGILLKTVNLVSWVFIPVAMVTMYLPFCVNILTGSL